MTVVTQSTVSRHVVQQRLSEIKGRPDHPDRDTYERLLHLLDEPEVQEIDILYADRAAWRLRSVTGSSSVFMAGGVAGDRWMLNSGPSVNFPGTISSQLTLIREGVEYPAIYNIGQVLGQVDSYLRTVLSYGLQEVSNLDIVLDKNEFTLKSRLSTFAINGRVFETNGYQIEIISSGEFATIFSRHDYNEEFHLWIPMHIKRTEPGGILKTFTVHSVSLVPFDSMSQECVPPGDIPQGTVGNVFDFRASDSAAWSRYKNVTRLTYSLKDEGETVYRVDRDGQTETLKVSEAQVSKQASWSVYWICVGAILGALASVIFVCKYLSRR